MNLKNFQKHIRSIIDDRGYELYEEEAYSNFTQKGNVYSMTAHGTEDYVVDVTLDTRQNIVEASCDCPYDYGPICKHIVALLYVIQEGSPEINDPDLETFDLPSRTAQLETILAQLDRKTVDTLLINQALRDGHLFRQLTFNYGPAETQIKLAYQTTVMVIETLEESYDEYGYYDEDLLSELWEEHGPKLQIISDQALEAPDPVFGLKLLLAVIEACFKAEDNEGVIVSSIFENTFEDLFTRIGAQKETSVCCALFETLHQFLNTYEQDVLDLLSDQYFQLMVATHCAEHKDTLKALLARLEADASIPACVTIDLQIARYAHLCQQYDAEEARAYLHQRLDNEVMLKIAYDRAMEEADYPMAIECAEKMLSDLDRPGHQADYETLLTNALMQQGDYERAKPILKAHTLKGSIRAFKEYISFFEGAALEQELEALLAVLKEHRHHAELIIDIAKEYKRYDDLIDYLDTFPGIVGLVYHVLPKGYEEPIYQAFEKVINHHAKRANTRSKYRQIARMYTHAQRALGAQAQTLEDQLLKQYPNRPALRDELQKARLKKRK